MMYSIGKVTIFQFLIITLVVLTACTAQTHCNCTSCTDKEFNNVAGGATCGRRIQYLMNTYPYQYPTEPQACFRIANYEFPKECEKCNPNTCNNNPTVVPPPPKPTHYCGCKTCTESIWSRIANGYTCGARISWVQKNNLSINGSEVKACLKVAQEYPRICGPMCNPNLCNVKPVTKSPVFKPTKAPTKRPTQKPTPILSTQSTEETPLYCFPPEKDRVRYSPMWQNYTIEVKESNNVCGPGMNIYGKETVLVRNKDELTLQYKLVNGIWQGSEVRVTLPPGQDSFSYGTYSFSLKSIAVKDSKTNIVKSTDLPYTLILGLFTWDPTDNQTIRENYSHEVDIEISRFGQPNGKDGNFLVQPAGSPQMYSFYTGLNNTRQAGGHKYQFKWSPSKVTWYTSAGGGQVHAYSTDIALAAMQPDYTQCLPANVEIRMNLWSFLGTKTPSNMTSNDLVEAVISDFKYYPSNLIGNANGLKCTKNCQCTPPSICKNNICTAS